jgi:hypothetical protein
MMVYNKINGFLGFVRCPEFSILENTTFRKLDLFPSSGEGREIPTLLGSLERANLNHMSVFSKGSNKVGVSLSSLGGGN